MEKKEKGYKFDLWFHLGKITFVALTHFDL